MINKRKGLEWLLKNYNGKIESKPRELEHHKVEEYISKGYRIVSKVNEYVRLDKGHSFIIYDTARHHAVIEYDK